MGVKFGSETTRTENSPCPSEAVKKSVYVLWPSFRPAFAEAATRRQAKAGIQYFNSLRIPWTPVFTGVTP